MSQNIIAVNFNNQSLFATLIDNVPYVAMKPICENIGLDWASQFSRIKRHPIMSKGIVMITTPSKGGIQEMLMLPLKMLNGWLFGVDSNRVKPEIKDAVIKYQEECFDVLANHFMPKQTASPYISEKEARLLQKAIISVAAGSQSKALYTKLYDGYGITTYHHVVPAGKVNEALVFLGLQPPEMPQYSLVDTRYLTDLEQKVKALPVQQPTFSIPNNMALIGIEELIDMKKMALPLQLRDLKFFVEQNGGLVLDKSQVDKMKGVLKA